MAKRLRGVAREAVLEEVARLRASGARWQDIAAELGLTRGQTKHLLREVRARGETDSEKYTAMGFKMPAPAERLRPASPKASADAPGETVVSHETDAGASFRVASYVYTGEKPRENVPRFTGWLRLAGDFMVINDLHIPACNWAFADRMLDVAITHLPRPRKVIIAGDLINGDALSRWQDLVLCTPLADELDYARQFLSHLAGTFDEIYVTRGNHENRLLLSMEGQLHAPQFWRLFSDNRRTHFSIYGYLVVESGGKTWRISHQRNYSRLPLSVARRMAEKYKANMICAHQHHSAQGRDPSNTYALIDSGGLHDSELMGYVMLDDSTAPCMANGFVLLRDGVGTLFTPAEYAMTDWTMWLPAAARRQAA
jgi:hypothetical protein